MSSIILPARSRHAIARREPNLLVPGKKPVGSVTVDWSNPLTRGLTHYWALLPAARLTDIVADSPVTLVGGAVQKPDGSLFFDGIDDKATHPIPPTSAAYTKIVRFVAHAAQSALSYGGPIHNAGRGECNWNHVGATYRGKWYARGADLVGRAVSIGSTDVGVELCAAMSFDSTAMISYINGQHVETTATGVAAVQTNEQLAFGGHSSGSYPSIYFWAGEVLDVLFFDRVLSPSEIFALRRGGNRLLIAANQSPFLFPVGSAYPIISNVEASAYSAASITPRCDINYP